jgi:4-aminobutyrate aminotransferase-like enzyme
MRRPSASHSVVAKEPGAAEVLRITESELRAVPANIAARLERSSGQPASWTTRERFWPMPICVDHGLGSHLVDVDGRGYIDDNMVHRPPTLSRGL